ncbi:class I SAM-dependent methyltransferase [Amycolatopsis sp. VS8301801F10]|uniref:class I SAM-dependent methyltransferase n=1 Tax=Amycolatopsis sp. VS8301801F10 TaxID=2652442 RepID=UPI0038FC5450
MSPTAPTSTTTSPSSTAPPSADWHPETPHFRIRFERRRGCDEFRVGNVGRGLVVLDHARQHRPRRNPPAAPRAAAATAVEQPVHLDGVAEVAEALRLDPGNRLLDLACGRGGYGLEIASRTGARLIGIDFAPAALDQARGFGTGAAEFRLGEFADTALPDDSVDAVVCVDAIQFQPTAAAFEEMRRVLRPGGRVALTTWEAVDHADERVPARIRAVRTETRLRDSGFTNVAVRERAQWRNGRCGRKPRLSTRATIPRCNPFTGKASRHWLLSS